MKRSKTVLVLLILLIPVLAVIWNLIFENQILKIEYPRRYENFVDKYAETYHVDRALIYAVIKNESNFNPRAKSNIGAIGLMQLTPDTYSWAKNREQNDYRDQAPSAELYDPETNIKYGTLVLSGFLGEFQNTQTALAAYHAGRNNVKKWLANPAISGDRVTLDHIPFRNTGIYVGRVLNAQEVYRKIYKLK